MPPLSDLLQASRQVRQDPRLSAGSPTRQRDIAFKFHSEVCLINSDDSVDESFIVSPHSG